MNKGAESVSRKKLLCFGEMVYAKHPLPVLREAFGQLCEDGEEGGSPFPVLCDNLGLSEAEAYCVALCFSAEMGTITGLTVRDLAEVSKRGGQWEGLSPRLFIIVSEEPRLHPVLLDFLMESSPRLAAGARLELPEEGGDNLHDPARMEELLRFAGRAVAAEKQGPAAIVLEGETGSGRSYLARKLAGELGCMLLCLPTAAAHPEYRDSMLLTAALYNALLLAEEPPASLDLAELADQAGLLLVKKNSRTAMPPMGRCLVLRRRMEQPVRERMHGYLAVLAAAVPVEGDAPEPVRDALCRLRIGQLREVMTEARAESWAAGKPLGWEQVMELLRGYTCRGGTGLTALRSEHRLDHMTLAPQQKKQLGRICAFASAWETVFVHWGFRRKIPWGQGITVLFYGPPGTGKTMAATAIANELRQPLYRVDLSQLISKYIGETQKNIGRVFDDAEQSGGILFFDEADALFSRRGDAADSQDKYANAEVAYLLQRTEEHGGLCILATNLLQNFDEAFRRRISYMVHFPLPDAAQRGQIWESIFPKEARTEALDTELLARELELSGASIKNCAVHAAYLAASAGRAIGMGMILDGAREEYSKQGKTLSQQLLRLINEQGE